MNNEFFFKLLELLSNLNFFLSIIARIIEQIREKRPTQSAINNKIDIDRIIFTPKIYLHASRAIPKHLFEGRLFRIFKLIYS